jgi:hypothetical protein
VATWQTRWDAAQKFWEIAQTVNDEAHSVQAAANAVLAIIAANDAICLHLNRTQPRGEQHEQAVQYLKEACAGKVWEREAREKARQLLEVLRLKNEVQYNSGRTTPDTLDGIMKRTARFIEWAEMVLGFRVAPTQL